MSARLDLPNTVSIYQRALNDILRGPQRNEPELIPEESNLGGTSESTILRPLAEGVNRIVYCWVPRRILKKICQVGRPKEKEALGALKSSLEMAKLEKLDESWGGRLFFLVAVTCSEELHIQIIGWAQQYFAGNLRAAAGWLVFMGLGMNLTEEDKKDEASSRPALPASLVVKEAQQSSQPASPEPILAARPRTAITPRSNYGPKRGRRPRFKDDKIPVALGEETSAAGLLKRRIRAGLSQSQLAKLADLSRPMLAEIERERRDAPESRSLIHRALLAYEIENGLVDSTEGLTEVKSRET